MSDEEIEEITNNASGSKPIESSDTIEHSTGDATIRGQPRIINILILVLFLAILGIGAYFRFTGLSWDDSYHLHPDERFLTDVATLLKSTDPITYLRTSESSLNPYNVGKTFYVYGNFPMTATRLAIWLTTLRSWDINR